MTLTSLLIKQTLQPFSHYDYYYYYYLLLMLMLMLLLLLSLFSRRSWRDSSARQQLVQSPRDCCRMASPIHQCSGRNAQRFLIQMRYFDRLLNRIHDKLLSLWRIRKKNFVEEMARFVLPFSFVTLRYLIKLIYYIKADLSCMRAKRMNNKCGGKKKQSIISLWKQSSSPPKKKKKTWNGDWTRPTTNKSDAKVEKCRTELA